ncbi:imidazole glycerol phosphate synthase cyclase subunit [uncultured Paraglaciecola sp.]|uniref:imidazole glycerol phosphate synthase subunit HisF n=1 Tax=uncultured Paraglaciecola sp. TaxID=1765024 RepID=UPI0025FD03B2|nr:imidazole glycerol phosphate synthase cyclase subunit [uncultured Paraglaciecola sp.]
MLKVRVIPTLLWKGFGLVKGVAFNSWRQVGTVLPAIKIYNARDVDEMILMDIEASLLSIEPDGDSIESFAEECSMPLTVGGGINNLEQVQKLLYAGADKVTLNSSLYETPTLINVIASHFGSQCLVASIDVRQNGLGKYQCYSHAGSVPTHKCVVQWAKEVADRGAGEILLTSIDNDGTMQGYDLDLISQVCQSVDIPVIASGGAGKYQDMVDAVQQAGASAVAAASIFHFTEMTPAGAKAALHKVGVPVRKIFASNRGL